MPDEEALLDLQRRLKSAGCEVTDVVDHQIIRSIYFTDPNGIALEASWWVLDATGRPADYGDGAQFADHDPVPAVRELAERGELRRCPRLTWVERPFPVSASRSQEGGLQRRAWIVLRSLRRLLDHALAVSAWQVAGLTDEEYLWRPIPYAWGVARRGQTRPEWEIGVGEWVVEDPWPAPDPLPMTSIGWRLCHICGWTEVYRDVHVRSGRVRATLDVEFPATAEASA